MKTFKELKNDVYELAQTKFGQITDEVRLRLDSELDGIEKYGRAELYVTLEALRLIRPTSLSELTEALAFKSENQYDDLMEYLSNLLHENFISTGRPEVDEMLSHTHGVVLFSRQRTECLKWTNHSYWSDEDEWQAYKERLKQLLKAGHAENKCDVYLEAHNLYKLAYIRQHYPDQYSNILNTK